MTYQYSNRDDTPDVYSSNSHNLALQRTQPGRQLVCRRSNNSGPRCASPRRRQLVNLIIDDSGSMSHHGKAAAATEGAREMIYQMILKSQEADSFVVNLVPFGSKVHINDNWFMRPASEIDEDNINFEGDSGGTAIKQVMEFVEETLLRYDRECYRNHESPMRVPPPLVILMSDGFNGDGDPTPVAKRIREMALAIGVPPIVATLGIEFGDKGPNVKLLKSMASRTDEGVPLYYHVTDLRKLTELIAVLGSSAASTPTELFRHGSSHGTGDLPFGGLQ